MLALETLNFSPRLSTLQQRLGNKLFRNYKAKIHGEHRSKQKVSLLHP